MRRAEHVARIEAIIAGFHDEAADDADLLLDLADGTQAIVQEPEIEGDRIYGRYLFLSTGLLLKKEWIEPESVLAGRPIEYRASEAKQVEWGCWGASA
jgi:hypothetical protein